MGKTKQRRKCLFDAIRSDEIEDIIANNIISSKYEVDNNVESAINFLTHKSNDRCMVKTPPVELKYRIPNYF